MGCVCLGGGGGCSVWSSLAVGRLSIVSVDLVQSTQQLLALQQVLAVQHRSVDLAVVAGELGEVEGRAAAL